MYILKEKTLFFFGATILKPLRTTYFCTFTKKRVENDNLNCCRTCVHKLVERIVMILKFGLVTPNLCPSSKEAHLISSRMRKEKKFRFDSSVIKTKTKNFFFSWNMFESEKEIGVIGKEVLEETKKKEKKGHNPRSP